MLIGAVLTLRLLCAIAERSTEQAEVVEINALPIPSALIRNEAPMFALWHTVTAWQSGDLLACNRWMGKDPPRSLTNKEYASTSAISQPPWTAMIPFASALFHDFLGDDDLWTETENNPVQVAVLESYRRANLVRAIDLLTVQTRCWMKPLTTNEAYSKHLRFRDLLLPGSHDAGCYGHPHEVKLGIIKVSENHFICQTQNITMQLEGGARIFDIRLNIQRGSPRRKSAPGRSQGRWSLVGKQLPATQNSWQPMPDALNVEKEDDLADKFVIGHDAFHLGCSIEMVGRFQAWRFIRDQLREWCKEAFGELIVLRFKPNDKMTEWPAFLQLAAQHLSEEAHIVLNEGPPLGHKLLSELLDPSTQKCSMILTIYAGHGKDITDPEQLRLIETDKTFHKYTSLYEGHFGKSSSGTEAARNEKDFFDAYMDHWRRPSESV